MTRVRRFKQHMRNCPEVVRLRRGARSAEDDCWDGSSLHLRNDSLSRTIVSLQCRGCGAQAGVFLTAFKRMFKRW